MGRIIKLIMVTGDENHNKMSILISIGGYYDFLRIRVKRSCNYDSFLCW